MSRNNHHNQHHEEHGTTASYIVGFILSLIFTIIPYYLVVSKAMTGTGLLSTILIFGVIQMIIQIVFFLHLGRGPKPLYNIAFFLGTFGIIMVVVIGSIFIMKHLHYNMDPAEVVKKVAQDEGLDQVGGLKTGACQDLGENHQVVIEDGLVSKTFIEAKLCDTLTFFNKDSNTREITFGTHPDYGTYAGKSVLNARRGRGASITLNQLGTYPFHDHLDPSVAGSFTVVEVVE